MSIYGYDPDSGLPRDAPEPPSDELVTRQRQIDTAARYAAADAASAARALNFGHGFPPVPCAGPDITEIPPVPCAGPEDTRKPAVIQPYEHMASAHEIGPDFLARWELKTLTGKHDKYHRMARNGQITVSHTHDDPHAPFTGTPVPAGPRCGTPMTHPDKSVSHCVLDKGHYITVEDSDHCDEHGHTAPVLVSQASIREAERVGQEWPDGVHTCAELQVLEPGRRPCTCGRCPITDRSE